MTLDATIVGSIIFVLSLIIGVSTSKLYPDKKIMMFFMTFLMGLFFLPFAVIFYLISRFWRQKTVIQKKK